MEHVKHITSFGLPPSSRYHLKHSMSLLAAQGNGFAHLFYERLFSTAPELQSFFPPIHRAQQQADFLHGIETISEALDHPHHLRTCILQLGERHADYGVGIEHFPPVIDTLLSVIPEVSGTLLDAMPHQAWENFLNLVRAIMLEHLQKTSTWRSRMKSGHENRRPYLDSHGRILLLDDDPTLLHLYQAYLEIQGFVCSRVSDIDWALSHLQMSHYDIVVTDYHMPRMNGIQVKTLLSAAVPTSPPWILMTGDYREDIRRQAMEAGFMMAVSKPDNLDELRTIIEESLKKSLVVS